MGDDHVSIEAAKEYLEEAMATEVYRDALEGWVVTVAARGARRVAVEWR